MLAPDVRTVAVDLLRPPQGYRLDQAVLTTYSLDLETLLALPLAVLAQSDEGIEALLADPLLLIEGLREARDRLHLFVDVDGMAIPRGHRDLYALLESSVHPVRAPGGGAFHPKVWVARFVNDIGAILVRVAVMTRNLTFDRSWDVALTSEAAPALKQKAACSADLAALLRRLPTWTAEADTDSLATTLGALADDVHRTRFPSPDGFAGEITYKALGLRGSRRTMWRPRTGAARVLAIAPFLSTSPLDYLRQLAPSACILVSRQDQLDALPHDPTSQWTRVLVLHDAAHGEDDDPIGADDANDVDEAESPAATPSGLHAKLLALEHGHDVTWVVGSANLTHAAWYGSNVEVVASVTGRKGRARASGGKSGQGIERFLEAGFEALCKPYTRRPVPEQDAATTTARKALTDARKALVEADLRIECELTDVGWTWSLHGDLTLPDGIKAHAWPVSRRESDAAKLVLPLSRILPMPSLTCFVAFRLSATGAKLNDERLVRKLPAEGIPGGRVHEMVRSLIGSPQQLLRFLRALLGGLEGLVDNTLGQGKGGTWGDGSGNLGGETLLEDLVRAASRDPARLGPIRRLLDDLQQTEEGRKIIPKDLLETWNAVQEALGGVP